MIMLQKLKLLVVQCATARSTGVAGGNTLSFHHRRRRRLAKRFHFFSKFRRLLRKGNCSEDKRASLEESKGLLKQRLVDLFASPQAADDESGGSSGSDGDNRQALELVARRGGGGWRFGSALGLRCRLLRRAWRPVLVAIPESD